MTQGSLSPLSTLTAFLFNPLPSGLVPVTLQNPEIALTRDCDLWSYVALLFCICFELIFSLKYYSIHTLMSPCPDITFSFSMTSSCFLSEFLFFCLFHLMAFLQLYSCCSLMGSFHLCFDHFQNIAVSEVHL